MAKHQEKYIYDALNINKDDFQAVLNVHKTILDKIQSFHTHSEYVDFIENEIKDLSSTQQALLINIFCRQIVRIAEMSTMFGLSFGKLESLEKGDKQDDDNPIYA